MYDLCNKIDHPLSLYFRNNLTIFDAIVVQGQGGRGEMKLSNKKPGSPIPLQFDMMEKHLKNCDSKHGYVKFIRFACFFYQVS